MAIYKLLKSKAPRKPPSGGMANDSGFSKPLPPMTVPRTKPFDGSKIDKSKLENPIYRTPKIEDPPLPPYGATPPPAKPRRPPVRNIIGGGQQVVSNIAAPYGSAMVKEGTIMSRPRVAGRMADQTPRVKEGTIYPRNPIPGRSSPRRPSR